MPIKIPSRLPAKEILEEEHIFVMDEARATSQDIRPLKIAVLNLMPTKIVTETQIIRLLSNSPLQIELTLLRTATHASKNTSEEHMSAFYKSFSDVKDRKFDGLIITGAPVENLAFTDVHYWEELTAIMEWSKKNVYSTLHICWAAQAGLFYHYGVGRTKLDKKISGVYEHTVLTPKHPIVRGFNESFYVPHSRYNEVRREDIEKTGELDVISVSEDAGVYLVASRDARQFFVTGHAEYDVETLKLEYERDINKGLDIDVPENYFPDNDPKKTPINNWRGHANLLYANWLNYFVYQRTPYDINSIG